MRVTSTVLRWSRRFSTSARVRASNTRHPPAGTSSLITVTKKIEEEDFDWYSPMARQLKGQIDDLPTELLERTLEKLEIQVLVACRQVSPRVKRVIDESVVLQYKIELETAGMEDGPPSEITIAERLQRLRKYTDSWASAQFGSVEKLRGGRGSMLRLSGNVLCRCFGPSNLVLNILPGNLRGVKAKEWRLDDLGFVIEDYAIDAAQDLLVIISRTAEEDRSSSAHMIHCLSLSTGQAHPHAARPKILFPDNLVYDIYEWFKLRLSGDFIGVMVPYSLNADEFQEHLVVWSWKEGTACMWLSEASRIEDFTFVNGFLLTGIEPSMGEKPRLHAYSIDKCSAYTEPVPFTKLSCFTFEYPSYDDHILIMEFSTISSLGSLPELEGSALFRAAPTDVYLAVQMCFESDDFDAEHNFRVTHVVPVSVLTSRIRQMLGQSAPVIPWEEWGPSYTVMTGPVYYDQYLSRPMHGVASQRLVDWFHPAHHTAEDTAAVFDFRVHRLRRGLQSGKMQEHVTMDPDDTFWVVHSMFHPCAKMTFRLPPQVPRPTGGHWDLAVTTDNIVLYNSDTDNKYCYILSI